MDVGAAVLEGEVAWLPSAGSMAVVVVVSLSMLMARGFAAESPGVSVAAMTPWSCSGSLVLPVKIAHA